MVRHTLNKLVAPAHVWRLLAATWVMAFAIAFTALIFPTDISEVTLQELAIVGAWIVTAGTVLLPFGLVMWCTPTSLSAIQWLYWLAYWGVVLYLHRRFWRERKVWIYLVLVMLVLTSAAGCSTWLAAHPPCC